MLLACEDFDLDKIIKTNVRIIDLGEPSYKYYYNPRPI